MLVMGFLNEGNVIILPVASGSILYIGRDVSKYKWGI